MVNFLFFVEESVVVNVVLSAMLVSPEQFIVSWILYAELSVLVFSQVLFGL